MENLIKMSSAIQTSMVRQWFCQRRLDQVCFHDNKMAQLESQCLGSCDTELLCLLMGTGQDDCGGSGLLSDLAQAILILSSPKKKGISFGKKKKKASLLKMCNPH